MTDTKRIDDGGAAFGHAAENGHCCGLSARDYFAAQALPALLRLGSCPVNCGDAKAHLTRQYTGTDGTKNEHFFDWPDCLYYFDECGKQAAANVAEDAYFIADAMLAERTREQPK